MDVPLAISITVSGLGRLFRGDWRGLLEAARTADDLGLDQWVMTDHLAIGARTDRYPYGRFPFPADEPWPEPLTTLAAVAGATQRIRLGTGILVAPLRSALLLAKSAATLDVLSGGRLDLGVGVGWQPEEFAAAGVPFAERWRRLDDTMRACRVLWSEAPASFSSRTVGFEGIRCEPRPVQEGGIPIWLGLAASARNARRIAELADGWMPMEAGPEDLRTGLERIRAALLARGRDPSRFGVRAHAPLRRGANGRPDLDRTLDVLPALHAAGATVASFALAAFCRERADVRPFLERLARGTAR